MPLNPADYAGYLIDLDGTLAAGEHLLPGASELLSALEGRFAIVSNDSEHTPAELSDRFRAWGLDVPQDRIVLAGIAALEAAAATHPNGRLLLLGSDSLRLHAREMDFELRERDADCLVIARDRHFDYSRLTAAVRAVADGARVILACPDLSHPGSDGYPVPEAGALAAAVFAVTGPVPHDIIGKPEVALFQRASELLAVVGADCLVIGDNEATDGAGAQRLGASFLKVVPGQLLEQLSEPEAGVIKR